MPVATVELPRIEAPTNHSVEMGKRSLLFLREGIGNLEGLFPLQRLGKKVRDDIYKALMNGAWFDPTEYKLANLKMFTNNHFEDWFDKYCLNLYRVLEEEKPISRFQQRAARS